MALIHDYHCICGVCTNGRDTVAVVIPEVVVRRRHKITRELIRQGYLLLHPRPTLTEGLRAAWDEFDGRNPRAASAIRYVVAGVLWMGFTYVAGTTMGALINWEMGEAVIR